MYKCVLIPTNLNTLYLNAPYSPTYPLFLLFFLILQNQEEYFCQRNHHSKVTLLATTTLTVTFSLPYRHLNVHPLTITTFIHTVLLKSSIATSCSTNLTYLTQPSPSLPRDSFITFIPTQKLSPAAALF